MIDRILFAVVYYKFDNSININLYKFLKFHSWIDFVWMFNIVN